MRDLFHAAISPATAGLLLIASHAIVAVFAFALGGGYGFTRALRVRLARRLGETLQEARSAPDRGPGQAPRATGKDQVARWPS